VPKVIFEYELCERCGLCVDACTVRLLADEEVDGETIAKPRDDRVEGVTRKGNSVIYDCPGCSNCRICVITCPVEAIYVKPEGASGDFRLRHCPQ
jgi:NAD-dependent dihydropyrimidine dehydrogenase PreA subunit